MKKTRKKGLKLKVKVIFESVMSLVLALIFAFFLWKTIDTKVIHAVTYSEKSNINYKVYLLDNEDYQEEYLEEGMQYIANIIDKVNINYGYGLEFDKKMSSEIKYSIIAHLTIKDSNSKKVLYEQKDILSEERLINNDDFFTITLSGSADVDFQKYNNYVTNFKNRYLLSTESNLQITMLISSTNEYSGFLETKKVDASLNVNIPLGDRTIGISKDNYQTTNNFVEISNQEVINYVYLVIAILALISVIICFASFFKHFRIYCGRKTNYQKELSKIMNEYDRIIVEATKIINVNEYNLINVKSFDELVDARDNINKPIIFAEVEKNRKSIFYLIDGNVLYQLVLEDVTARGKR